MDDNKKMFALIKVARKVFASNQGVLTGNSSVPFAARNDEVEIGIIEMPKVIVVGIALGVGIDEDVIGDSSALDLGETHTQITKNISMLKRKYDLAAKELLSGKPDYSFKAYALKHNQLARRFNNALGNQVMPDFPYHFVREKEIGEK